jgi:hypothetical protein
VETVKVLNIKLGGTNLPQESRGVKNTKNYMINLNYCYTTRYYYVDFNGAGTDN